MRITVLALGSRGDIQPFIPLGRGLQAAGHCVKVASFADFAGMVTSAGLEFAPVRGDARALLNAASQNGLMARQDPLAVLRGLRRSYGQLAETLPGDLLSAARGCDLLLNQLPANLFGPDLADYFQIPLATAAVIPLAATASRPLFGFPRLGFLPGYNRLTYSLAALLTWQLFRAATNRWRVRELGLPARGWGDSAPQPAGRPWPVVCGFSQKVVPRPADWGEHIAVTGWWLPREPGWQPPADLLRFLEDGPAPVFIGFGSMPVRDPAQASAMIAEAARQAGVRVLLHAGWAGLGSGTAWSGSIFALEYAPYAWLFPRLGAILHHGGSGTTGFALHSGVPSAVLPFAFDQFFWGERSAALGVGPAPLPFRQLTTTRLAALLTEFTRRPAYRQAAERLAQDLRAEDGVSEAVRIIEGLRK